LILHRAFIREVVQNVAAVAFLVLFIFLVVRITDYLQLASEGTIPMNSVLTLLGLRLLSHLDIILPLAVYLATLLVLVRWSRDREIIVAAASGFGPSSFLKPILYLVIVLGVIISSFSLSLSPLALRNGDDVEHEFRTKSDGTGIVPGVFVEDPGGDGVYYVETFDSKEKLYRNVFIWLRSKSKDGIVVASRAQKTVAEDNFYSHFLLRDGVRYDGTPGSSSYQSLEFETYGLLLDERSIPQKRKRRLAGWKTTDLWKHKHDLEIRSELHWRISKIIILPVLMLLALALAYNGKNQNRAPMMMGALLTYFAYANLAAYLVALSRRGHEEPLIILWILHTLISGITIFLFWRRANNQTLFIKLHRDSR
jgi:lipopolysaccharide export system permease protein